jgi:hypothetical protein
MSPQPYDSSPFYFHHPSDSNSSNLSVSSNYQHHNFSTPTNNNSNPRKRPFASPDGPFDESFYSSRGAERPASSSGSYDYGSESRPQSRRLSVMELCNDDELQQQQQRRNEQQYRGESNGNVNDVPQGLERFYYQQQRYLPPPPPPPQQQQQKEIIHHHAHQLSLWTLSARAPEPTR